MTFLYFTLVFFIIILILYFWKFGRRDFLLSKIPSLKSYPFFHHGLYFLNMNPVTVFKFIVDLHKNLGDTYYISYGRFDEFLSITTNLKIIEKLLTSNVELTKTVDYELLVPWTGRGLLTSTDKKWFQRRKLLAPGFHFQLLEKFVAVIDRNSDIFANKLEQFVNKEINIFKMGTFYALDTVSQCIFGKNLNSQLEYCEYAEGVKEITNIAMIKAFHPIKKVNFLYQFTDMYRKEKELIESLHAYTHDIIESRREELLKLGSENITEIAESKKKALIDILLTSTIDGVPLTNEDIQEEINTFLFVGHDSTAGALSFIFYNIAKYPEVQQKIYDEISKVFDDDEKLTISKLNDLHYTELVIKESLRLFPTVPMFGRKVKAEFTADGKTFPKNTNILVSPYLLGRCEKYFKEPEAFKPERFEADSAYGKISKYAYIPFSNGPRNCIGNRFSSLVLRGAILKVVKKFKLSLGESCDDPPVLAMEIVLRPANGIFIKFETR